MSDTHQAAQAFPLSWPPGWARTPAPMRQRAAFHKIRHYTKADGTHWKTAERLEISDGLQRLEGELRRLNARGIIISSNLQTTSDGRPYTRQSKMLADPGVAVYFTIKGKALALACDKWQSAAENMAALAGHIEAIRASDRYGVGTVEQAFAGYKALPADTARDWRQVFGFAEGSTPTRDQVTQAHRRLAREQHPDAGGSNVAMAHLNRARDYALDELK
jgi:hypothetical protein